MPTKIYLHIYSIPDTCTILVDSKPIFVHHGAISNSPIQQLEVEVQEPKISNIHRIYLEVLVPSKQADELERYNLTQHGCHFEIYFSQEDRLVIKQSQSFSTSSPVIQVSSATTVQANTDASSVKNQQSTSTIEKQEASFKDNTSSQFFEDPNTGEFVYRKNPMRIFSTTVASTAVTVPIVSKPTTTTTATTSTSNKSSLTENTSKETNHQDISTTELSISQTAKDSTRKAPLNWSLYPNLDANVKQDLEKLVSFYENGYIDEEEFETQKKLFLGQTGNVIGLPSQVASKKIETPSSSTDSKVKIQFLATNIDCDSTHPFQIFVNSQLIYKRVEPIPHTKEVIIKGEIPSPLKDQKVLHDHAIELEVKIPKKQIDHKQTLNLTKEGYYVHLAVMEEEENKYHLLVRQQGDDEFAPIQTQKKPTNPVATTTKDTLFVYHVNIPASEEYPFQIFVEDVLVLTCKENSHGIQKEVLPLSDPSKTEINFKFSIRVPLPVTEEKEEHVVETATVETDTNASSRRKKVVKKATPKKKVKVIEQSMKLNVEKYGHYVLMKMDEQFNMTFSQRHNEHFPNL